jgi:hypothetical protein
VLRSSTESACLKNANCLQRVDFLDAMHSCISNRNNGRWRRHALDRSDRGCASPSRARSEQHLAAHAVLSEWIGVCPGGAANPCCSCRDLMHVSLVRERPPPWSAPHPHWLGRRNTTAPPASGFHPWGGGAVGQGLAARGERAAVFRRWWPVRKSGYL